MKELALHVLDVAENGVTAGATKIEIVIKAEEQTLDVYIIDNGKGMNKDQLQQVRDPFFTSRTTRKVGMGIPLFMQHSEMTGGKLEIESEPEKGCKVKASFCMDHPDAQPLGDIEGVWLLLTSYVDIDIVLSLKGVNGEFSIGSMEAREMLELVDLNSSEVRQDLKRLIRNKVEEVGL